MHERPNHLKCSQEILYSFIVIPVAIIVQDEKATRTLHNGFKHNDFAVQLCKCTSEEMDLRRSSSDIAQTISLEDRSSSECATAQSSDVEVSGDNMSVEVIDSVQSVSSPTVLLEEYD
ncbi:hypothetical protein J6590_107589 [Homalodisca vitripennis]|nr:hypothetical protein J6590_107589 [Homalodisca vitripennis]